MRLFCNAIWDVDIVLSGDVEKMKNVKNKFNLLICNHQVDSDWLYLMQFTELFGLGRDLCIMLKKSIQYIFFIY